MRILPHDLQLLPSRARHCPLGLALRFWRSLGNCLGRTQRASHCLFPGGSSRCSGSGGLLFHSPLTAQLQMLIARNVAKRTGFRERGPPSPTFNRRPPTQSVPQSRILVSAPQIEATEHHAARLGGVPNQGKSDQRGFERDGGEMDDHVLPPRLDGMESMQRHCRRATGVPWIDLPVPLRPLCLRALRFNCHSPPSPPPGSGATTTACASSPSAANPQSTPPPQTLV